MKTISFVMLITLTGKTSGSLSGQAAGGQLRYGDVANAFSTASRIPGFFRRALRVGDRNEFYSRLYGIPEKKGHCGSAEIRRQFCHSHRCADASGTAAGMLFLEQLVELCPEITMPKPQNCARLYENYAADSWSDRNRIFFCGYSVASDEFIPALISVISNVIIILYYIFLSIVSGICGLAVSFVIGWAMEAIVQIPPLRREKRFFLSSGV